MSSSRTVKSDTLNSDIVIIGAGGAGLAAAVAAAEKGAKNIVILEAGDRVGGNAVYAAVVGYAMGLPPGGKINPDPQAQKDEKFLSTMDFTHWRSNASVVRAVLEKDADGKQWLEKNGMDFTGGFTGMKPGGPRIGAKIAQALFKASEANGVRVLYQTKAKQLITDRAGKVVGVLAEAKGKELEITAKSVIIATGGIFSNKRLMKKYFPHYETGVDIYIGGETRNGDGLLMATKVGAATEPAVAPEVSVNRTPWSAVLFLIAKHPSMLLVNKKGKRFVTESSHHAYNSQFRQPGMTSYAIFDESIKKAIYKEDLSPIDKYVLGSSMTLDVTDKKIQETLRGKGLYATHENWTDVAEQDFKWQAKLDKVKVANSWDAIARWMGVDPKVLRATVDEYNAACKKGHDDAFAKDKKHLQPLLTPPYYAIRCYQLVIVTHGGISVSEKMEVLDRQGDAISGLYAAGCDASLASTDTYSGDALGWHINSARIAGESAAKYASGKT
jgi:fumarate reductase flavoprotein subunit